MLVTACVCGGGGNVVEMFNLHGGGGHSKSLSWKLIVEVHRYGRSGTLEIGVPTVDVISNVEHDVLAWIISGTDK